MKPQYFDSQKAAAIISEPNDDRRSLMVDALTGDEAKLLCKLLLEFVPRKGAKGPHPDDPLNAPIACARTRKKAGLL